jgi:glucokinase
MENDGRCFGLGEYYFGKGQGADSLLSLTVGTGIGGGFIFQGKTWRGAHHSALEVSYLKDFREGGNWEERASGRGIEYFYRKISGEKITAEEIFSRWHQQDSAAAEAVDRAADALSLGIASLVNIFDPEKIVIGGGLSQQEDFIQKAIKQSRLHLFNRTAQYQFATSNLNRRANLLGAGSLYFKR